MYIALSLTEQEISSSIIIHRHPRSTIYPPYYSTYSPSPSLSLQSHPWRYSCPPLCKSCVGACAFHPCSLPPRAVLEQRGSQQCLCLCGQVQSIHPRELGSQYLLHAPTTRRRRCHLDPVVGRDERHVRLLHTC